MLARRLTASPTVDTGWLVGVDFEATKNQWLCVITASAGLERKSSQYSVGLSKDQEVAQKSLRPARQLCTSPSSPIPLGWRCSASPRATPGGFFLAMPAACKASNGGHLALNFASERRTTPGRAMPASSASRDRVQTALVAVRIRPSGGERKQRHRKEMREVKPHQTISRLGGIAHEMMVICPDDGDKQIAHCVA